VPTALENARPRLRGVIHHYAFFASLAAGGVLVASAPAGRRFWATVIYAASLSALLGVSALYHRITWTPAGRRWMGRLDHSMIHLLIAGTYTPFGMLALSDTLAAFLLRVAWGGAAAGITMHLFWLDAPKWLSACVYVAMGWVGVAAMPSLVAQAGWTPVLLLVVGGLVYSLGAFVYAVRRPDPVPTVFGYHEVFHALVVVAASAHYAAVAVAVLS
jgi:hemolysin III